MFSRANLNLSSSLCSHNNAEDNNRSYSLPSSAVILGGGQGKRMGGNKIYLAVNGQLVIQRVIARLRPSFEKIIIATGQRDRKVIEEILTLFGEGSYIDIVTDRYPGRGPLEGLASALEILDDEWAFVTGCDMPCINDAVIRKIWQGKRKDSSVVCVRINGFIEPLSAFYHSSCSLAARRKLSEENRKLTSFYEDVEVSIVDEAELAFLPGYRSSFKSMNTPEDLRSMELFCSR